MELEQNAVIETEITPIQKTGGTSDYENLTNKPSINDIELEGNKTLEELGIYNYDDTEVKADISALEDIEETQNQEIVNIKANKADKSEIPDVSDFITNSVNDLINYYLKSETYTKTEVNNLIGAINQFHYEIVQALPITGENNILYLVPKSTSETNNIYDEYVYASGWEKIGDTEIDLSNYVTTTQLNTALADYTTTANLTTLLAGKQDVLVSGTNIKTINNESILGSGDITISGGGSGIVFGEDGWIIHLANDVEPGIYVTKSSSAELQLYDLEEIRTRIKMPFGFFYVVKKYSEASNGEVFLIYLDGNNSLSYAKSDNTTGYIGPYYNAGEWVKKSNVLLKDNSTSFTPTGDYNPATKKYVDDAVENAIDDDFGKIYLFRGDAFNTSDTQLVKIYKQIKADFDNGITSTFINFSNSNLYDETTKYASYGIYRVEKFNSTNNKLYLNSIDWRFSYEDNWYSQSYSLLQLRSPEIIITFDSNGDITAIASESNSLKTVSFLKTTGYGTSAFVPTTPGAPASKKYVDDSIASAIGTALGGSY